jgi:hypothetical protein
MTVAELLAEPLAAQDRVHMARALELAARGLYTTDPNPRVGCVLVRDDRARANRTRRWWHCAPQAPRRGAPASMSRSNPVVIPAVHLPVRTH